MCEKSYQRNCEPQVSATIKIRWITGLCTGRNLPGYEASLWYGAMLPAGTPRDIVTLLHSEITKAAKSREVAEPLTTFAIEMIASTPEQFASYLAGETAKWGKVIREANIRAD